MLERAWSNLSVWQKDALAQCVVFQAPFTLMAAESVVGSRQGHPGCTRPRGAARTVVALPQQTPQGPAFRVFASVRSFLRQQDAVTGGLDALQLQHALWTAERVGALRSDRSRRARASTRSAVSCPSARHPSGAQLRHQSSESALATQLASPAIEIICEEVERRLPWRISTRFSACRGSTTKTAAWSCRSGRESGSSWVTGGVARGISRGDQAAGRWGPRVEAHTKSVHRCLGARDFEAAERRACEWSARRAATCETTSLSFISSWLRSTSSPGVRPLPQACAHRQARMDIDIVRTAVGRRLCSR